MSRNNIVLLLPGRITIFRTFMMSKALYISATEKVPGNFLSELEKINKDFIWENNRPKIKIQH